MRHHTSEATPGSGVASTVGFARLLPPYVPPSPPSPPPAPPLPPQPPQPPLPPSQPPSPAKKKEEILPPAQTGAIIGGAFGLLIFTYIIYLCFTVRIEEADDEWTAHDGDEEQAPAADKKAASPKATRHHKAVRPRLSEAAHAEDVELSEWDEPGATPRPPPERKSLGVGAAATASLKGSLNSLAATSSRNIRGGHKLARTITARTKKAMMQAMGVVGGGGGGGGGGGSGAAPKRKSGPSGGGGKQRRAEADAPKNAAAGGSGSG